MPYELLFLLTTFVAIVGVYFLRKRGTAVDSEGTKLTLAESIRKKVVEKQDTK